MACLFSSSASQLSTGNWTFTEALLDGLRGEPDCDADGDGTVSLEEIATSVRENIDWGEEQRSTSSAASAFDPRVHAAAAPGKASARIGERVEVTDDGERWKARIVAVRPGGVKLHWRGTQGYPDEWVKAATVVRTMATARSPYRVGQAVEGEWKRQRE